MKTHPSKPGTVHKILSRPPSQQVLLKIHEVISVLMSQIGEVITGQSCFAIHMKHLSIFKSNALSDWLGMLKVGTAKCAVQGRLPGTPGTVRWYACTVRWYACTVRWYVCRVQWYVCRVRSLACMLQWSGPVW